MNQDKNNSTQNTNGNNTNQSTKVNLNKVDPKTVEPQVLGHLRTEKVGNPWLLVAFLIIIAIVLALLPLGTSMLQNKDTLLYKLVYGNDQTVVEDDTTEDEEDYKDGTVITELKSTTKLKVENLIVQSIYLYDGKITAQISSYTGTLDLDDAAMYLNIYSSLDENDLVGYVKLIGSDYDYEPRDVSLYNQSLSFNKSHSYFGKIVTMEDSDYPAYDVAGDESGIGSVTCTKDNREIEYVFQNNYLIAMTDRDSYKVNEYSQEDYLSLLSSYTDKADLLGSSIATVNEEEEGFTYFANLKLEGYTYPDDFKDIDYYKENALAKIVIYDQIGKGYDCK